MGAWSMHLMRRATPILLLIALTAGCAPKAARMLPATTQALTTRPTDRASLSLDDIEPRPELPAPKPTTRPAQPPLEALELYAHARDAYKQNQRYTAITN